MRLIPPERRSRRVPRHGAALLVVLTLTSPALAARGWDSPPPRRAAAMPDTARKPAPPRPAARAAPPRGWAPPPLAPKPVAMPWAPGPREWLTLSPVAARRPAPLRPREWVVEEWVVEEWRPGPRPSPREPRGRGRGGRDARPSGPPEPRRMAPLPVALPARPPAATPRPPVIEMPQAVAFAELAMLSPRTPLAGTAGTVALPQPLAPSDAARLRRIFEMQGRGETPAAIRESERLDDRRLIGHVLADRWLRPGAPEPSPAELRAWLSDHADHPDAPRLHAMLVARLPRGASPPPALPGDPDPVQSTEQELPPEEVEPPAAASAFTRNPALDRTVREMAGRGDTSGALLHIARTRGMTPAYAAALQGEVAQVLFASGRDAEAFRVASAAAATRGAPAQAAFIAGLSAWGQGQYEAALPLFEQAARSESASAVQRAAAAFWTARAAVRARRPQSYVPWMLQAAQEPRTFYGLVARRALGLPFGFAWERELAGDAEAATLAETAGGWRALALLQIGQRDRAEAELRRLLSVARGNASLNRAMLAVATGAGMTDLAASLAAAAQTADGRPRDFARFPVPTLTPQSGWRVDPALIYGLVKQESNFNAGAVSPAGARGLAQVMPSTAAFITGDAGLRDGLGQQRLHDPGFSLELGQRYLHHLATQDNVNNNLVRLLAAYNAGPGNLARWLPANGHRDDPFLFIESIPFQETRTYVQRVLAYSFIYASRLGLPSPSLDALAAGSAPRFVGVEELARLVARGRRG
ncbi:transglycosylase SLT domain-containing protein [Muricoccus radiodurans]|uniref:lytic transglycosylase domain-containing protein n=1 Tax=Muricoccus radiodurans TaxID=2231721 RepID=UPI003CF7CF2E